MDKEQARKLYELADRLSKLDVNTLSEEQLAERTAMIARLQEVKQRLDPKCWDGYKKQGTKIKSGVRVNNCVPESIEQELNEFAPDGFNGGDGDGFSPEMAKMAYDEGFVKGASLADGATTQRAMAINDWDKHDGGIYSQHFAKGFIAGRKDKIRHNNKQYNLNLKLMKDGSIRHGEQGVAEAELDEKWSQKYKDSIDCNHPKGFSQKAHCAGKNESIEESNGEYDDEAGMAQSNLHTMARAVNGLLDTIEDNDNLPEWAQEKIAKAEMMVTSVWDYLLSQKEQGVDPKVQETKKPSPKLTPVNIKKTDAVSEEINTEAYERLQKVFAFKNYES